jgi:hypothetical protein
VEEEIREAFRVFDKAINNNKIVTDFKKLSNLKRRQNLKQNMIAPHSKLFDAIP